MIHYNTDMEAMSAYLPDINIKPNGNISTTMSPKHPAQTSNEKSVMNFRDKNCKSDQKMNGRQNSVTTHEVSCVVSGSANLSHKRYNNQSVVTMMQNKQQNIPYDKSN